jgi:hypothetical protein
MRLNLLSTLFAGAVAALLLPSAARSAPIFYDFSFVADYSAGTPAGDFSGELEVDGTTIIGITGSGAQIGTITALLPTGSGFNNDSDNLFSTVAPYLSNSGVAFSTTLFADLNMYTNGGTAAAQPSAGNGSFGTLSVTPAPVSAPEPASLVLLAAGVIGLAAVRRRGYQLSCAAPHSSS